MLTLPTPPIGVDGLMLSLARGRVGAVVASGGAFVATTQSLYARMQPLLADGYDPADAVELLNNAGPMLSAGGELLAAVLSLWALVAAGYSKFREWRAAAAIEAEGGGRS